jgi:hypothetical protein
VKAHLQYIATRPAEAESYKQFQVSPERIFYSLIRAVSLTRVLSRCGTVSRWTRAMPRVILWGMVGMGIPLSRSRSWGMLMRVVAMTVVLMLGLRVRWTRMERGFHCMGVSRRLSWVQSEFWGLSLGRGENSIMSRCGLIRFPLMHYFMS